MFFVLLIQKTFLLTQSNIFFFFENKTVFQNLVPNHNFFFPKKHQKLFLKTVF